jgi:hypothetical protein
MTGMKMRWIETVLRELISLFVEDGSLALAILAWLAAAKLIIARFEALAGRHGAILFAGLALILVENTLRRARTPLS